MGRLIYSAIASVDGYVADEDGKFDWSQPDQEVHTFVNDLTRQVGTHLYGREMYEVMQVWETMDVAGQPRPIADFAEIWRGAEKVVFSRYAEASVARR
jgi:dihydrofolate reductase